jgi:glycosyltransferase involved in cell wall biosynthesis
MMRAAFFAPMKPPSHPVASGDRTMAQALIAALALGGVSADVASTLQTRDGKGNAGTQARIMEAARAEVARLTALGQSAGWQVWITYHNYYKAPDLIGPAVAAALKMPYLLVEATRARKRLTGPWAGFARAAEASSDAADVIFYLTAHDEESLRRDAPQAQKLLHLPPFLPRDTLPEETIGSDTMLSVGMMRAGDKFRSYGIIADTLAELRTPGWRLEIVGDGPMRDEVAALMSPFGTRVTFLGAVPPDRMDACFSDNGLLFWPGVNEAFGMVYLEAQAAGLAVVAQDRPGVRDVLLPGLHPPPAAGPRALAARIDQLIAAPELRRREGRAARGMVAERHLIGIASSILCETIRQVIA